ncbi:MAG: glycosyltransferase [Solirubrobacteraceae bacterium]|nr:glycosyltransferase [Solirubrobacteraceae bacterium]
MPNSRSPVVAGGRFALVANGAPDSPPASGVRDYLLARGARVIVVHHPLGPDEAGRHHIVQYDGNGAARRRVLRLPSRTPFTYPLDLVIPPAFPRVDGWLGFNNLMCLPGLLGRRAGRVARVVYWAVDFVPDRFGAGSPLTRAYDALDAYCCRAADARLEVAQAALDGRNERHGLTEAIAPAAVSPIGTWLDRVPKIGPDAWQARRVVFIGHLVERMGVDTMVQALEILKGRGVEVHADIAGRGPLEDELRTQVASAGLAETVTFHGFIAEHQRLERLLADASVALAPYSTRMESFTRFADPSKLKSYLGAGLPILLTDVPPNAMELEQRAGAEVVADDPASFADAIARLLDAREEWQRRRLAALDYAQGFDWNTVLDRAFDDAGFTV